METPVSTPYRMSRMLGGIMTPRVPPVATMAPAKPRGYLRSSRDGTIPPPTAAVVAGPEPELAEKNMDARMVTMPSPPRMPPIMASATSTSLRESPPRSMTIPARKNMGTAMRGKELTES